jgi:phage gp36-like protein
MAFTLISTADLYRQIKSEFWENLTLGIAQVDLDKEEGRAIQTIKDKLRHRYDLTDPITDKDSRLIEWVCTIMVYKLARRQNSRSIPDSLAADYDSTMKWLDDIRDGKEHPDFPTLLDGDGNEDPGSNELRSGSRGSNLTGDYFLPEAE